MSIVVGANQYGKAETHLVHVVRDGQRHHLRDLTVSIALAGEMTDVHLRGDNAAVLPTDSQKNTVFAFAAKHGVSSPEAFAVLLARHFVDSQPSIQHARVAIEEQGWDRIEQATGGHSFLQSGQEVRTAVVVADDDETAVSSGLTGLVVLNSTDSEFHGYLRDEYTTLAETWDRVLATAVQASWRHTTEVADWDAAHAQARAALLGAFANTHSLSLQQTLYAMGHAVLEDQPEIAEVTLSLPNRHHFLVDLEPFGLTNDNEVYYAADRPYGLIEGTVRRDDAPAAGPVWRNAWNS